MTTGEGASYLLLFVGGFLATDPWRWAGVLVSHTLDAEHEALRWVRAVSTALIAGLVTRMVIFSVGALEHVPLWLRLLAFAIGIAVFFATRRSLALGILAGVTVLVTGQAALG